MTVSVGYFAKLRQCAGPISAAGGDHTERGVRCHHGGKVIRRIR